MKSYKKLAKEYRSSGDMQMLDETDKDFVIRCQIGRINSLIDSLHRCKYKDILYTQSYNARKKYKHKVVIE